MNLMSLTAVELGRKIKAKEVTVKEAVTAALDAIEAKEVKVNSFVTVDREGALKRAEEVQKLIDDGTLTGPLAGVPVAVKDNMCTKDVLTTCSSNILYNFKPTYSAQAVENLEAAGAVMIGKTNMDEFAMGSTTETSAFGATKSPCSGWFLRRFLCGSGSGGVLLCPRFRYWRFYPSAKLFLWGDRYQTDLRNRFKIWADRLRIFARPDRTDRKGRDGLCYDLRGNCFL